MSVGNIGLNPEGDFVSSFTGAATTVNDKGLKVADEMLAGFLQLITHYMVWMFFWVQVI